jgi:hypothetical protein
MTVKYARRALTISAGLGLIVPLAGCGAPSPYYANRPVVVAPVMVGSPPPAVSYVYGSVHSTNETHITSESTVHIITNHPDQVSPPATDDNQAMVPPPQVDEPAPPEEEAPRSEPAAEPDTPAAEPEAPAEPPSDSGQSDSGSTE